MRTSRSLRMLSTGSSSSTVLHQEGSGRLQEAAYFGITFINLEGRCIMSELAQKTCIPCKGGVPPLKGEELKTLLEKLGNSWNLIEEHHLEKEYLFNNFREGLDFTIKVGELAENQGHHPDIYLAWGKVRLTVWTYKIDGLTESDFIFAAKADQEL